MKKLLLLALTAAMLTACSDPKDIKINNSEDISVNAEKLKKLPEEDRNLLVAYIMRAEMSKVFSKGSVDMYGVTVGEAIEKEKEFQKGEKEKSAAKEAEQAKEQAKEAAKAAQLNNAIEVMFLDHSLKEDYLDIYKIKITNKSQKVITGIKGNVRFEDKFGDKLKETILKVDFADVGGRMDAGLTYYYNGELYISKIDSRDQKFVETPTSDVKFIFEPTAILFEDGTKLEK